MKLVIQWKIKNQVGKAELTIPRRTGNMKQETYANKMIDFLNIVDKLNANLNKAGAEVVRRVEK